MSPCKDELTTELQGHITKKLFDAGVNIEVNDIVALHRLFEERLVSIDIMRHQTDKRIDSIGARKAEMLRH